MSYETNEISNICSMKIFRNDPDMTPNNYDIYFDVSEIPINIKKEKISNLQNRLQKLMPLSKKIHICVVQGNNSFSKGNTIQISSKLRINKKKMVLL